MKHLPLARPQARAQSLERPPPVAKENGMRSSPSTALGSQRMRGCRGVCGAPPLLSDWDGDLRERWIRGEEACKLYNFISYKKDEISKQNQV